MLKHSIQDVADKLREKDQRTRKTLNRSVIKEKVRERFKFGKNFIQVKDCNDDWTRVCGSYCHRVYIDINDAKRIRQESTVPFYDKKTWLLQVGVFLKLSLVHSSIYFFEDLS